MLKSISVERIIIRRSRAPKAVIDVLPVFIGLRYRNFIASNERFRMNIGLSKIVDVTNKHGMDLELQYDNEAMLEYESDYAAYAAECEARRFD